MVLSHKDLALDQNVLSIMDITVTNDIKDGAFALMTWINTLVAPISVIMRAKKYGAIRILSAAGLHDSSEGESATENIRKSTFLYGLKKIYSSQVFFAIFRASGKSIIRI